MGKVKEYIDGKIIFEGEFFDGQKNGKGKEYNKEGQIIFEGEYMYDEKLKGKEYIKEKLEYEGEYLFNRKWNGKGFDTKGNKIYELINGTGNVREYKDANLNFEGNYIKGKKNGHGKKYFDNGKIKFEGEYENGKKNGEGIEFYRDGLEKFKGEYRDGDQWNGILTRYENGSKTLILLINGFEQ